MERLCRVLAKKMGKRVHIAKKKKKKHGVDERSQSCVTQVGLGARRAQVKCTVIDSGIEEG